MGCDRDSKVEVWQPPKRVLSVNILRWFLENRKFTYIYIRYVKAIVRELIACMSVIQEFNSSLSH